jgi:hypothetical protein
MKRTVIAGLVAAIALLLIGSLAYAHWRGHDGIRAGRDGNATNNEAYTKFKDEAAPLREQLLNKRDEIRAERHKPVPDSARITQLQEEMTGLRTQIHSIGEKHGVNAGYFCGAADCPTGGKHAMGRGRHGQGMHRQGMANWNCPFNQK